MRSLAQEKAPGVEFSKDLSILKIPLEIDGLSFPNRIAIQPLEAADADSEGAPTPYTKERYLKYAEGGAGLIWFEACSLDYPEARSHEKMLVISKKTLNSIKKIVNEVKEVSKKNLNLLGTEGRAVLVLQLSHAGRYR
jgi:2,4-dienoyl-CoA reductase-like NADH-dependent reductase (Old Yellow Enzyme family)